MKTYELTFVVNSPYEGRQTLLDIEGILHDGIEDCNLEYRLTPIKFKEED